jgi:CRISPR-associated protein (TIGR03984 family)
MANSRQVTSVATTQHHEPEVSFAASTELIARLQAEAATLGGAAWLIAWLDYAVTLGLADAHAVRTDEPLTLDYLQEVRLFAPAGEWRLWRSGDGWAARRRLDGAGLAGDALDDDQSLWGTAAAPRPDGWTVLSEDRGIRYAIPHRLAPDDLPLRLRVRNYLADDHTGMAGVVDSRLVALCDHAGRPLAWEGALRASVKE